MTIMRFKNLHSYGMTSYFANVPTFRTILFLLLSFTFTTIEAQDCDNLTDGGIISGDESGCNSPIFDPSPILSTAPASGGSGTIEYLWMKTTGDPNSPFNTWQIIPGADGATYDPTPITETTYFGRCSRRSGCTEYIGETNFVVKSISCCDINAAISPLNSAICTKEPLSLAVTGNGTGFTYLWEATGGDFDNPQAATPTYTMMIPGIYTIKVTITMGSCMEMTETTVTVENQLPVSITADHTYIAINQDLPLNSTVAGLNPTYAWSTSGGTLSNTTSSDPTFSAAVEGDFEIYLTATDENGCSGMDTFDIRVGNCELALLGIAEDASCTGINDGAITLTTTGATGEVNYTWGQIGIGDTNNPLNLAAATYTVTATDSRGCTDNISVEVGAETTITLAPNIKLPTCSGDSNGQILIIATGGSPNYTFNWSNGLPDTAFVNNLSTGTYNLTVTDANGCQATGSYQVDNPTPIVLTTSSTDPTTCGSTDGTATVVASGGTVPYTYVWNDGANQTTATATNLAGGTYQVVVTDANGCQNTATVTIDAMAINIVLTTSSTDPTTCGSTDGTATVVASGGTVPYTYAWNDGANQTTATATNLAGGTYQVVVTDANGCQNTATATIDTMAINIVLTTSSTDPTTCGSTDGMATVVASGGTAPYTYVWNDAANQTTATATNLAGGTYQVIVTDANGCQNTATVTINAMANNIVVTTISSDTGCGMANGTATVATVNGGTPPYTYAWNDAASQQTPIATNLAGGTYQVVVTDANGCQNSATVTISAPVNDITLTTSTTEASCGLTDGTATVIASGGTAPYTYVWNDGGNQQTATATNLAAGTYQVIVTDANGCQSDATITLLTNPVTSTIVLTATMTNATCSNMNGAIDLNISGGIAPYIIVWDNGIGNVEDPNNLSSGVYSVVVTDATGCSNSTAVVIGEEGAISVSLAMTNISCNGGSDGTATATPSGGMAPYTYNWSNGINGTATLTNLSAATYTVTVTDANGCQNIASSILLNPDLLIVFASPNGTDCVNPNGSAIAMVSGGTPGYTFLWSDANNQTTQSVVNLPPGDYTVTVTDMNGCTASATTTIDPSMGLMVTLATTNTLCNGENSGTIMANVANGTAPYSYTWNNFLPDFPGFTGLSQGTYDVTVTDANGCFGTATAKVHGADSLIVTPVVEDADCNADDGRARLDVTGGTAPYTYAWDAPLTDTTAIVTNLAPGGYSFTVTDANGCTNSDAIAVLRKTNCDTCKVDGGIISTSDSLTICAGDSIPDNITVALTGNIGTNTNWIITDEALNILELPDTNVFNFEGAGFGTCYIWSVSYESPIGGLVIGQNAANITGCHELSNNLVVVREDCSPVDSCTVIGGVINTADSLTICAGDGIPDNITVALTGNMGTNTSWVVTDEALNILELPDTNVFNFEGAGFGTCYIWSVSYENPISGLVIGQNAANITGCHELSNNLVVVREDCSPVDSCTVTASTISTDDAVVFCVGDGNADSVKVNLTNGTGAFSRFIITNTASTILDISTETIYDFENMPAGISLIWNITYEAGLTGLTIGSTIDSLAGCFKLSNVITIVKQDCRPDCTDFEGSVSINNPAGTNICAKAEVSLSTTPAETDYTYNWTATGGTFDNDTSATPTYSMMMPGTYQILVTVTQGECVTKDSTMVTILSGPEVTLTATDATCQGVNDGSISTTVTGGTAPFTYTWSDTTIANVANPTNLAVGTYDLTVTDANGCATTGSATINEGALITLNLTATDIVCSGINQGSINTVVTGGIAPYTYIWSDNNIGNIANPANLAAGTYGLMVVDANGCSATDSITINDGITITINLTPTNSVCGGMDAGSILSTVSGGVEPYTYSWSNGATTDTLGNLAAGMYEVTVTDANGCQETAIATVNDGANISITLTPISPLCAGGNDGSITSNISGGAAPYTYSWSNGINNDSILTNLTAGDYSLTVTDANGCTVIVTATVDDGAIITIILTPSAPFCAGVNDGSISSSVSGGTAPYTYSWSNGTTGVPTLNNLLAGDYNLTVTDANGCMTIATTTINEGVIITVDVSVTNPVCASTAEGSLTANPSDGVAPYAYNWSNGATTATINNLPAGSYDLTVTDDNGCSTTATATIAEPNPFDVTIISTPRDICPGGSVNFGAAPADTTLTYQWTSTGGSFDDATGASPIYTMMMPGVYEIILTVSNGICTASDTTTVTVSQGPTVAMTLSDVICAGDSTGSISVTASSDNEPITYTWDNGIGNIPNPTGLAAGDYNLTITDAAGCTVTASATIGTISNLNVSLTPSNLVCSGASNGSITAATNGGIAPITYAWSNGAGNVAIINNLAAGTYSVTATDVMGCSRVATTTITEPTPLFVTINNSAEGDTICGGTAVNLTAIPTDTTLTYSWTASGGSFDNATIATPVYTMMMPGTHEIIVAISNGICNASDTTYVTIGEAIDFSINPTDISCVGETDGSITVAVNNGVEPITYTWDNGIGNIPNPTGLAAGTYNLTVTDGHNCETTASVVINDATAIVIGLVETNILCGGDTTGAIDALVIGGASPLTLAWSNGANDVATISNLSTGTYTLTVMDANGCTAIDSVTITEPTPLTATTEGADVGCNGSGHAHVTAAGGTIPYTYLWDDGLNQTTDTAFNLVAGIYNVTVTDANGCTTVASVAIIETSGIICEIQVLNDIETFNGSEGQLGVEVTGGSGNYTYNWNNGGMDSVINNLSTNTYIVTITDELGCTCIDTFQLLNPAILGDFVWEDTDSSGTQDIGEPGVEGVTLQVSGTTYYDEMIVRTIQTDINGGYQFNLPPGGYKVTVVDALGFIFTSQNIGGDDATDSDFDPINNMSQVVTLAPNDVNLTIDLGLYPSNVCRNILLGGAVRRNETLCGPSGDPMIITNLRFPSGGVGQLEYLWLKSDITMDYYPGHPDWTQIPDSNTPDYDPGVITKTTYYIRCSRRRGCNSYPGESNIITKTIIDCAASPSAENLRTNITAGQVELAWDGKIPYTNGNFIIERSTNGIDFKVVSTMASPISETMEVFHFMDEVPNFGENYYRIKTAVPDMESNYSNIAMAMVKPNSEQKVMVYPNPVQHEVTIHFLEQLDESAKVHIVNGFGQVMQSLELDTQNPRHQVDISELPSGIYYLKFENRELKRLGQKIYKVEE